MRVTRVTANLRVADVGATKSFYTDFLGLSTEEFDMGWVARYTSRHRDQRPARHAPAEGMSVARQRPTNLDKQTFEMPNDQRVGSRRLVR